MRLCALRRAVSAGRPLEPGGPLAWAAVSIKACQRAVGMQAACGRCGQTRVIVEQKREGIGRKWKRSRTERAREEAYVPANGNAPWRRAFRGGKPPHPPPGIHTWYPHIIRLVKVKSFEV